jgi:cyclophilin family peptidyl-prolyl cis-trans isomerase/HEAT repeat protein
MRTLAVGILGAVVAGCAARGPVVTTSPLSDDALTMRARLLAMSDARRPDSALLETALEHRWGGTVRAAAALAAGQVGARAFAPRLRVLLADGDSSVAGSAAFALGLLRDSASVDALAATYPEGGVVAREAMWALGEIGAPSRPAIEFLLQLRGDAPTVPEAAAAILPRTAAALEVAPRPIVVSPTAQAALLLAAQRLRPVPVALVLPYLPDRNAAPGDAPPADRPGWAAAYALTRSTAPSATRKLLEYIPSPDAEIRALVANGLRRAATGDSLAADAIPALELLVRDPDAHVRVNAARALGSHGETGHAALMRAFADLDRNVRVAAAQSIARVVRDSAEWERLWAGDTTFMVRRSLLANAALAGIAVRGQSEWSSSSDWRLRLGAAEAATGAPLATVRRLTLPLLRDADGRVRAGAIGVAAAFADSATAADLRAALVAALDDDDYYARATAMQGLSGRAMAAEVPAVLRSYERARRDSANDARLAAVSYLAAAWRRDSAAFDETLRTQLAGLAVPTDPLEREPAIGLSPFRNWPGREGRARELGWYRDVLSSTLQPALAGRVPQASIITERGEIVLELFGIDAPLTVHNFMTLARAGFFRDTRFHRVVPNFVAQDGDPRGDGNGSPGYAIRDELGRRRYERGAVGMALSGPDTGGSQYFLTLSPQPHLDGHYTVFGRVVRGWQAMDDLVQGDRILRIDVR